MIDREQVIQIHEILIERFGGSPGIKNNDLLDSALNRPFQTFDGKDLYPTIIDKASALLESILINHPFTDGNKRIGYVVMRLYLMSNGLDINATEEEKYKFVISVASGMLKFKGINEWLAKNTAAML